MPEGMELLHEAADNRGSDNQRDSLVYQMEQKYFCAPPSESWAGEGKSKNEDDEDGNDYIIDIFGTSAFPYGASPLVAAHERVLRLLVLDELGIRRLGRADRCATLARNVTELVLARNAMDWRAVAQLLRALPQLRALNLAHNAPLGEQVPQTLLPLPEAPKMDVLILNGLPLRFGTLHTLLCCMPNLRELHLAQASLLDLQEQPQASCSNPASPAVPAVISARLQELHLNECGGVFGWCQVLTVLAHFPRVHNLFLADNPIDTVDTVCPCRHETETLCSEINALSLSNTLLSSWESIENLAAMGRLRELRVAHVPLLDQFSEEERRHLVIGRLRSLKVLNGSKIDPRQREESERFFIRYYAEAEKKPLIYDQLVAEHGMLEQLAKVDLTPKKHAKVLIHCDETEWARTWVRLRLCGTVLGLMKFAERLTNIPMRLMRLFYLDKSFGPTELRTPGKELRLLHIEDGDEFVVQSKIVYAPPTPADGHAHSEDRLVPSAQKKESKR